MLKIKHWQIYQMKNEKKKASSKQSQLGWKDYFIWSYFVLLLTDPMHANLPGQLTGFVELHPSET